MDKFNGFEEPTENWSKLPHALINNLHLMTSESEIKVVLYILRHTWGYGDDQKKITIDEFHKGRKKKDGSRLDNGLGISENAIRDGISKAIEHGFIEVYEDSSDKARIKRYYCLHESTPGVQKLNPRGSEVEPHHSEVEPRTEKETIRKTTTERELTSRKSIGVKSTCGKSDNVTPGPFNSKLLELCQLNIDTMTKRQRGYYIEVLKVLERLSITITQLDDFSLFWKSNWRGKGGAPPSLNQVLECWGECEAWVKNGKLTPEQAAQNEKPKPKPPAIDAEYYRRLVEEDKKTIYDPLLASRETIHAANPTG